MTKSKPRGTELMGPYATEAALLKALAHPVRLQIAHILSQREACVCHLEEMLHLRQPYISQQMMVLREAGLLQERRAGTFIYYHLADAKAARVLASICRTVGACALEPASCPGEKTGPPGGEAAAVSTPVEN